MATIRRRRRKANRARNTGAQPPIAAAALDEAIASVDAPAYLVAPRVLRRVIRQHRELTGLQIDVPHGEVYHLERERLLHIVELDEIGVNTPIEVPDRVILLKRPDPEALEVRPASEILSHCWRQMFHGMIHLAEEERAEEEPFSLPKVRCWIRRVGMQQFAEAREVLENERLLLFPDDTHATWVEFVATFWELYHFAPLDLRAWFPGIDDPKRLADDLRESLDPAPLLKKCRPRGAVRPTRETLADGIDAIPFDESFTPPGTRNPPRERAESVYRRFVRRAERAADRGNLARSLILRMRARMRAPKEMTSRSKAAIRDDIDHLIRRLLTALDQPDADGDPWREPLVNLVQRAAGGFWTPERRLLYDLQKVCIDRERKVYRLDLVGWLRSFGRQRVRQPLPRQQNVLVCRHLRSARRRLERVHMSEEPRRHLNTLLHRAEEQTEEHVRTEMRPAISEAITAAGLTPTTITERVAAEKLVEELLDQIVEHGFLSMGGLRDGLARNGLKVDDLTSFQELVFGDQLLRVDRQLARTLDGVHRRGEFYLRWMQSVSSLAFATRPGRFFTRWIAVPFGGAYLLEAGVQHMLHKVTGTEEASNLAAVLLLGVFLLGLLNSLQFRAALKHLVKLSVKGARYTIVELPQRVLNIPLVLRVLKSPWFRFTYRLGIKPVLFTMAIYVVVSWFVPSWQWSIGRVCLLFFFLLAVVNTRFGRDMEEIATEWFLRAWERLGLQVVVRVFSWVFDLFRRALDSVERLLYAVDEWLRFRTDERGALLVLKSIGSPVWNVVRYIVRFCVNLLIEPQVNPIKHFPVVTVSHKVLLPFIPALAQVFQRLGFDTGWAYFAATTIIALLPGICGFLVWELRGNWGLYGANRPVQLLPVHVGHHGETIPQLLRPGFHSGTIPKRFAKLRHAQRRAKETGRWSSVRRHLRALDEIELSLERYIERELIAVLRASGTWPSDSISISRIRLSTNRIAVEFEVAGPPETSLCLWIDRCAERLVGHAERAGSTSPLDRARHAALNTALVGLFKTSAVDLLRSNLDAALVTPATYQLLDENRLLVWTGPECDDETLLELTDRDPAAAGILRGNPLVLRSGAKAEPSPFGAIDVPYTAWLDTWQQLAERGESGREPFAMLGLLPREQPAEG